MFKAEVKYTPDHVKSGWVVCRRDKYTAELKYFEYHESKERAYEVAQELDDGVVLESVEE